MNVELQMNAIQAIQSELEAINLEITATQSIPQLIDLGGRIAGWMAFSANQMPIAKRIWRKETARAYDSYVFSKMAQGLSIPPSMANKYAEARAGDHEANYEFVERINRATVHVLDLIRTAISALKEEQKITNYRDIS